MLMLRNRHVSKPPWLRQSPFRRRIKRWRRNIAYCISKGMSNSQIAKALGYKNAPTVNTLVYEIDKNSDWRNFPQERRSDNLLPTPAGRQTRELLGSGFRPFAMRF